MTANKNFETTKRVLLVDDHPVLRKGLVRLIDSIPQFEIAQVYLTIATEKLGNEADARHAALRLIAAERTEAHYATLDVPVDVRKAFEQIASRILTSDQVAILHAQSTAIAPPPAPRPNSQPPAPIIAQPVAPIERNDTDNDMRGRVPDAAHDEALVSAPANDGARISIETDDTQLFTAPPALEAPGRAAMCNSGLDVPGKESDISEPRRRCPRGA